MNRESVKRNPIISADDINSSIPMPRAHSVFLKRGHERS